jgi:RNA 2',3'-cyclic 3'-phosphodiesterase
MKRIFIAVKVEPGEILLRMLTSFKILFKNESIKWTSVDNIHITLAFLGDTQEEKIKAISDMLNGKCEGYGKLDLNIKGVGIFKNLYDPRVIWTGIGNSEKLIKLNSLVIAGLKDLSVTTEGRQFNPHLTLGRIKSIKNKNELKTILENYLDTEIQKVPVDEIILYESILLHTGPVYKPIKKFSL